MPHASGVFLVFHITIEEALDVFLLLTGALLDTAEHLVEVAFGIGQVVVGELAPLLLEFAFDLIPLTLQTILVHDVLLVFEVPDERRGCSITSRLSRHVVWTKIAGSEFYPATRKRVVDDQSWKAEMRTVRRGQISCSVHGD